MHHQHIGRMLAALFVVFVVQSGCARLDRPTSAGAAASDGAPAAFTTRGAPGNAGTVTQPAQHFGYVMSQQSSTLLVVDTSSNEVVKRLTHPDMVKPASGRFHPSNKRFYAGGTSKLTIWDTTKLGDPVYLKTVVPAAGSVGEYRGVVTYNGSTTAIDGDV
jgi:hypothetical protein